MGETPQVVDEPATYNSSRVARRGESLKQPAATAAAAHSYYSACPAGGSFGPANGARRGTSRPTILACRVGTAHQRFVRVRGMVGDAPPYRVAHSSLLGSP